ncbi:MAG: S9 family peptidase [Pyrinomonadaceae bacterium]|nr:S9 family peptidase [Pyrinomonadaceae bacterium]
MPDALSAPYGTWKSPITSDLIVGGSVGLSQPLIQGEGIYWIEMRPNEGGRNVLVKRDNSGATTDLTPAQLNVRTRVHEYGGGDYTIHDGLVCFSNFSDQRLYRQSGIEDAETPEAITPSAGMRYADARIDPSGKWLICVREDHTVVGQDAVNTLVRLDLNGNDDCGQVLVSGNDFYSSPRLTPDGSRLAWLTWNHPNMPWDGTELWIGEFGQDQLFKTTQRIAGGLDESIFQPEWSPEGVLHFVSDRSGWWNLYRVTEGGVVEAVCEMEAEFGMPQWGFGMSSYAFESADTIVCTYIEKGMSKLALIDTQTKKLEPIDCPYTDIRFLRASPGQAVMRAGSSTQAAAIVKFDFETRSFTTLRRSNNLQIDADYVSVPRAVEFPTEDGLTAHAFFYPPKNPDFRAPEGELPPLLVESHGGPTSAAATALSLNIQYWTSRGIAVLDVNYGGSSGFGRVYRERLKGKWGIVDVDDCVNGALFLVRESQVDGKRLMITGGSAGGYTTLCALTFRRTFKAGASHYGVSDVEALARETHKFESRYLDGLMGRYPEMKGVYYERSPINFAEQLACPVIFFQGLDDQVVPPNQAEAMVGALRAKRIPVAYIAFEGEQHGFRQAQNIKRALDAELYFYSQVFGFELAEPVEPVEIENL